MINKFDFQELSLKGAYLISPFSSQDDRGWFIKDYSKTAFMSAGLDYKLEEVFYTVSKKGVIRALHFQETNHQPKLVRCISGRIFDVIVDLRPDSPTFKKWLGFELTGDNKNQLLIPGHFAHGYLVLEDSIVSYKCSEPFDKSFDSGIRYDDPDININWPFDKLDGAVVISSERDDKLQSFQEYLSKGCK